MNRSPALQNRGQLAAGTFARFTGGHLSYAAGDARFGAPPQSDDGAENGSAPMIPDGSDDGGPVAPAKSGQRRTPFFGVAAALVVAIAIVTTVVVVNRHRAGRLATTLSAPAITTPYANCTNSKHDAAMLQSVIDASATSSEVLIHGPCLIDRTITLLGGRSYRGESRATTLTEAPGTNLAAVLASDSWVGNTKTTGQAISLQDLTIDANAAANKSAGDGVILRSWQSTIADVNIMNSNHNGLRVTNLSENGTALTNTQVNGTIRSVFISGSGENGIYVQDSGNAITDWHLIDSWIAGSGQNAVLSDDGAGWTISGNNLYGNGAAGLSISRLFATDISDNYIEDFATFGIVATVQGSSGGVVARNRIFNFSGKAATYLAIVRVNYGAGDVAITANTVHGNGTGTGLLYQGGTHQLTVTSTGNQVSGVSVPRSVGTGAVVSAGF